VIGRAFDVPALEALRPAAAAGWTAPPIGALVGRELIAPDPEDDQRYRFRHVLIRDAAYNTLSIRDRIRLHEAHADWVSAAADPDETVRDDLIGIHLEQAYRYRQELGDRSTETREVGGRAGRHLMAAGERALARGDIRLADELFARAVVVLPEDTPERARAELERAQVRTELAQFEEAQQAAAAIAERGPVVGLETYWLAVLLRDRQIAYSGRSVDVSVANARRAIEEAAPAGLHRVCHAAWRTLAGVSNVQGQMVDATRSNRQALLYAQRAGDRHAEVVTLADVGSLGLMDLTPVDEAIARPTEIRDWARANGQTWLEAVATTQIGRGLAMAGRFDEGRLLVAEGISTIREVGVRWSLATTPWYTALVEFLAGDYAAAVTALEPAYVELAEVDADLPPAYTAEQLSRLLILLNRWDEAEAFAELAARHWPSDRFNYVGLASIPADALLASHAGRHGEAEMIARTRVERLARVELFLPRALSHEDLATVLDAVGRHQEAHAERAAAIEIYERKGVTVLADRLRRQPSPA
jgi:tetratricopeptide (TPR) repeat protein